MVSMSLEENRVMRWEWNRKNIFAEKVPPSDAAQVTIEGAVGYRMVNDDYDTVYQTDVGDVDVNIYLAKNFNGKNIRISITEIK